jgi:hypothetical protein
MMRLGPAACVLALSMAPLAARAAPTAAPMHTQGANPVYPRLAGLADARVMAQVNALIAAQEKTDRASRADCLMQLKAGGQTPTRDSYSEAVTVTYLSGRLLSLNVVSSYDCGGPYPNDGIETPMTFDLASGRQIDWSKAFKPGFLPSGAKGSMLTRLYRAAYPKDQDADCRSAMRDDDPFSEAPILWLDSKRGLMVQPDFPHAIAACAEAVALPAAGFAPYLKDAGLAADLQATIKPARR